MSETVKLTASELIDIERVVDCNGEFCSHCEICKTIKAILTARLAVYSAVSSAVWSAVWSAVRSAFYSAVPSKRSKK